ncbi:MAG: YARHG domain-containing protein [Clostridia bacterium]|nr:YARHG domain-containing protein [Clostridia bacterium]
MKKALVMVLCLMLTLSVCAGSLASSQYIIPDSNTRKLTYAELWQWNYESLGYILNEIFARHGYVFEPGSRYDNYFSGMNWYKPNSNPNNTQACYPKLNSTEWYNERLIKDVRAEMRRTNNYNKQGKSLWKHISYGWDALQGFELLKVKAGQKWPVYSAPSEYSWRAANGKAKVSTNDVIYAAGWEKGWLMVMYETNHGAIRVGYVPGSSIKGSVNVDEDLNFDYADAEINTECILTDDPATQGTVIAVLEKGDKVTYLSSFLGTRSWAYIETEVAGQTVRGFVHAENVDVMGIQGDGQTEDNEDDIGSNG